MEGPVLGLDLGTRRIGLAVSDSEGVIAFPIGVLERRGLAADVAAVCDLIRERGVRSAVVGLPLHMDGRSSPGADAARAFAAALGEAGSLPVALVDERLTTVQAERALRESPKSHRRKQHVDALAATLILRTYLEQPREVRA